MTRKQIAIEAHSPSYSFADRYNTEIDILRLKRVGTGALQEAKVWIDGLYNLMYLVHCVHQLHPAGNHHWAS